MKRKIRNRILKKMKRLTNFSKFSSFFGLSQCMSSVSLLQKVSSVGVNAKSDSLQNYDKLVRDIRESDRSNDDVVTSSATTAAAAASNNRSTTIVDSIKSIKDSVSLSRDDLWSLCPILLYQLTAPTSLERTGCVNNALLLDNVHSHHLSNHADHEHDDRTLGKRYFCSLLTTISICMRCNSAEYFSFFASVKRQMNLINCLLSLSIDRQLRLVNFSFFMYGTCLQKKKKKAICTHTCPVCLMSSMESPNFELIFFLSFCVRFSVDLCIAVNHHR